MHREPRILVVDGQAEARRHVKCQLQEAGYEVATASSGMEGLEALERFGPDLVLTEAVLPGLDGFEFAARLKASRDIPLVFLTILDEPERKAAALRDLAEDYITKPYDPDELCARLDRVLRYNGLAADTRAPTVVDENLSLDLRDLLAHTARGSVRLTTTEARLLFHLSQAGGRPLPADTLLNLVWRRTTTPESTLRAAIHRLRDKLEPDPAHPRYLVTRPRIGYLLAMRPDAPALTEQQSAVLRLVAQGCTDNEAAVALGISSRTVGTHMQAIRNVLGASSRAHAIALAMSYGLLSGSDVQPRAPPVEM
jgi:DNA-binding response OmpR family regulator